MTAEDFTEGRIKCYRCNFGVWRKHGFDSDRNQMWECKGCGYRRSQNRVSRPKDPSRNPPCPFCTDKTVVIICKSNHGSVRWRCKTCRRTFGPMAGRKPCSYCLQMILSTEFDKHRSSQCLFRPKAGSNKRT